jgi:excisionase family DNA binding protein
MGTTPDPNELLTPTVAAQLLGCSVDSVRGLADRGELPVLLTSTGRRLFKRGDVDELRERRALLPHRRNGALASRRRPAA